MRILVRILLAPLAFSSIAFFQTAEDMKMAGDAERAAGAAYRAGQVSDFLKQMETANSKRPNHPRLIYNLAVAYAKNGRDDDALSSLERLTKMGLGFQFEKDDDFDSLKANDRFKSIVARSAANRDPVAVSVRTLQLRDKTMIAESVAYDPNSKSFYVGSIHQRKVVVVDSKGVEREFSSPDDGLFAVLGMKVDPKRRVLWAATSAVPQMRGYLDTEKGRSGIVKYDLRTGKLLGKYLLPEDEQHMLGDVWIDERGDVFATDSVSPNIYKFDTKKAALETFIQSDMFASLQGITAANDRGQIYVADYAKGIFRIDLNKKSIVQLKPDVNVTVLGIDGLYFHRGRLIAIQNGITPNRVAAFSVEGDRISSTSVLEANHPDFLEPTLGVIDGDDLYFIANSQWPLVNEKAELQNENLRQPVILKLGLN